ncbi:hypothetical protein C7433_1122 [Pantoea sp. PNA 03-3]|nr:hypothetical protein C7433_1122 [Pantoea sp. PNA 03-3]
MFLLIYIIVKRLRKMTWINNKFDYVKYLILFCEISWLSIIVL